MNDKPEFHTDIIECPNCGRIQEVTVEYTERPWWAYTHYCEACEYQIEESEWNKVKKMKRNSNIFLAASGIGIGKLSIIEKMLLRAQEKEQADFREKNLSVDHRTNPDIYNLASQLVEKTKIDIDELIAQLGPPKPIRKFPKPDKIPVPKRHKRNR